MQVCNPSNTHQYNRKNLKSIYYVLTILITIFADEPRTSRTSTGFSGSNRCVPRCSSPHSFLPCNFNSDDSNFNIIWASYRHLLPGLTYWSKFYIRISVSKNEQYICRFIICNVFEERSSRHNCQLKGTDCWHIIFRGF